VALAIFLFVTITVTLYTFILPGTYASTARVLLLSANAPVTNAPEAAIALATQVELIESELVLTQAVSELDLTRVWGQRYAGGERLRTEEALTLLRQRIEVRHVHNTALAQITVFSEAPDEAARIANQIAAAYCSVSKANGPQIVDRATPGFRPVRPNKPLNISLAVVIGCLLGGLAAAGVLFLPRRRRG
jgi:uncharacterized protein involved in exopolysaccharide biosynthesis